MLAFLLLRPLMRKVTYSSNLTQIRPALGYLWIISCFAKPQKLQMLSINHQSNQILILVGLSSKRALDG